MGFVRPSKRRYLLQQEIDFSSVHTAATSDYLGFQGNGCDCGQASIRAQLRLPLKSNVSNNPKKYPSNETQSHLPPPPLQSHQIPQLLDIKSPQPFFARADNLFGQD